MNLYDGYTPEQQRAIESVLADELEPMPAVSLDELPEMEDPMPEDPDEELASSNPIRDFADELGRHMPWRSAPVRPVLIRSFAGHVKPTAYGIEECLDAMELQIIGIRA